MSKTKRPRWEYIVLRVSADDILNNEKRLDELGSDGWELVGVGAYNATNYLYLRRASHTAGDRQP